MQINTREQLDLILMIEHRINMSQRLLEIARNADMPIIVDSEEERIARLTALLKRVEQEVM
jgi:hypothetical protein